MILQIAVPELLFRLQYYVLMGVGSIRFAIWLLLAITTSLYRRIFPKLAYRKELDLLIRIRSFLIQEALNKHKIQCSREHIEIDTNLVSIYFLAKHASEKELEKVTEIVSKESEDSAYVDLIGKMYRIRFPLAVIEKNMTI